MNNDYFVYVLTNEPNQVMYICVTSNLLKRLYEHKNEVVSGFTSKYHVHKLVYFEQTTDISSAILREKQIKKWRREKKNKLVEQMNPEWNDLSLNLYR